MKVHKVLVKKILVCDLFIGGKDCGGFSSVQAAKTYALHQGADLKYEIYLRDGDTKITGRTWGINRGQDYRFLSSRKNPLAPRIHIPSTADIGVDTKPYDGPGESIVRNPRTGGRKIVIKQRASPAVLGADGKCEPLPKKEKRQTPSGATTAQQWDAKSAHWREQMEKLYREHRGR